MGRFADNIRRIAGVTKTKDNLQPQTSQAIIDAVRGIAYYSASGATATVAGKPGTTTDPNSAAAIALAAANAAALAAGTTLTDPGGTSTSATDAAVEATIGLGHGAGGGSGGSGGGASASGPTGTNPVINKSTDGNLDVKDTLDNKVDNIYTQGNNLFGNGQDAVWNSISGWKDHRTGQTGILRRDSYIPPAGWITADEPPVVSDTSWLLGFAWGTQSSGAIRAACSFTPTLDALGPLIAAYLNGTNPGFTYTYTGFQIPYSSFDGGCNFNILNLGTMATTTAVAACARFACPRFQHDGVTSACTLTAPVSGNGMWDGTTDFFVVPIGGYFQASPRDPLAPSQYSNKATPQSSVYMDFDTTRKAVFQAAINGTNLLYEVNASTLVPIGTLHVYNQDGTLRAYDAIANLSNYLPH